MRVECFAMPFISKYTSIKSYMSTQLIVIHYTRTALSTFIHIICHVQLISLGFCQLETMFFSTSLNTQIYIVVMLYIGFQAQQELIFWTHKKAGWLSIYICICRWCSKLLTINKSFSYPSGRERRRKKWMEETIPGLKSIVSAVWTTCS